jgi:hypothetical protein
MESLEGGGVVGVTDDARWKRLALAFYEGVVARKAVDLGDFVPKCAIVIKPRRKALEGVAPADHIATPAASSSGGHLRIGPAPRN